MSTLVVFECGLIHAFAQPFNEIIRIIILLFLLLCAKNGAQNMYGAISKGSAMVSRRGTSQR